MAQQGFIPLRYLRLVLVSTTFVLLGACSSAPKATPPTVILVSVDATTAVNPDLKGRASPIVVRVFELKSISAFNSADFFSLWDRERETLSAEINGREEFLLQPGEQKKFERTAQPDTRYVGVIAAYRDLERSNWRGSAPIVVHQKQPIAIRLDARSVSISGK